MREIAAAADVTTPVVYDHFRSKADLYGSVVQTLTDDLLDHWADQPAVTPGERFSRTIDAIFSWIERNEQGWRLLFGHPPADAAVAGVHHSAQEQASRALTTLFHQLPELNLSTELDRARADELLAEAAKSAVNAVAAWWWNNRDVAREHVVRLVSDLLWRGLHEMTRTSTHIPTEGAVHDATRESEHCT